MKTASALVLMLWATIVQAKEIPDGFNGYPWGTSYKSMDSISLGQLKSADTSKSGELRSYNSQIKMIGDCKVEAVMLTFLDGDLSTFTLSGEGHDLFRCIYALLLERYGKPKRPRGESEFYTFDTRSTSVYLAFESSNNAVVATIMESIPSSFERYAKKRLKK